MKNNKFKEPRNCWEFKNCSLTVRMGCPAYKNKMGRECWLVAGNHSGEGCPDSKEKGLPFCVKECPWFRELNPNAE